MKLTFLLAKFRVHTVRILPFIHMKSILNETLYSDTAGFASYTKMLMLDPAVSLRQRIPNSANAYIEYLSEFEVICITALARESGPLSKYFKGATIPFGATY
jgi:hypothetical protein